MSLATAQKILTDTYGGITAIVPGSIVILPNQEACSAKYDEVCIRDHVKRSDRVTDWKVGDCAKDDEAGGVLTEGFAWKDVVYVNGETSLVTATAHEVLHINEAKNYRTIMGDNLNEGTTEYLARKALKAAAMKVPSETAYPTQVAITKAMVDLVGEDAVMAGYFSSAAPVKDLITAKAKGKWYEIWAAVKDLNLSTAQDLLKPKA